VSFAAITLCVASQRAVPKVSIYFVIDSFRKFLDTPSYINLNSVYAHGCMDCIFIPAPQILAVLLGKVFF